MRNLVLRTVAALLLLAVMVLPVFAATNSLTVEWDKTVLRRGDTVVVNVAYKTEEAVSTVSALLKFDETVFELVEGKCTEGTEAVFTSFNEEHVGLALLFSVAQPREGALGSFTLRVKDAASFGSGTITVEPVMKNGADTLTAQSVELHYSVECPHDWSDWSKTDGSVFQRSCSLCKEVEKVTHGEADHAWGANGLCVACGVQRPPEPTTEPTTEPAEVPAATGTPAETEGAATETEGAAAETQSGMGESMIETQMPSAEVQQETPDNSGILWVLLAVAAVAGGCAAVVLLRKKRK